MPAFIKTARDERLWCEAKAAAAEAGLSEEKDGDRYWRYVNGTYQRMAGKKKGKVRKAFVAVGHLAKAIHVRAYLKKAMHIELGTKGLRQTHQLPFPPTTKCVHCGGEARIAFTGIERGPSAGPEAGGPFICDLYRNNPPHRGEDEKARSGRALWPHDCAAFAVYLCKKCLERAQANDERAVAHDYIVTKQPLPREVCESLELTPCYVPPVRGDLTKAHVRAHTRHVGGKYVQVQAHEDKRLAVPKPSSISPAPSWASESRAYTEEAAQWGPEWIGTAAKHNKFPRDKAIAVWNYGPEAVAIGGGGHLLGIVLSAALGREVEPFREGFQVTEHEARWMGIDPDKADQGWWQLMPKGPRFHRPGELAKAVVRVSPHYRSRGRTYVRAHRREMNVPASFGDEKCRDTVALPNGEPVLILTFTRGQGPGAELAFLSYNKAGELVGHLRVGVEGELGVDGAGVKARSCAYSGPRRMARRWNRTYTGR